MKIEGKNAVREIIESEQTINKLYVQNNLNDKISNDIISLAKSKKIKIDFVSKQTMDNISFSKRHQGFICESVDFEYSSIEDILSFAENKNEDVFLVLVDGVSDPHNLGAIIRTCECAGVHGIIITERRACPVNETVITTSSGAAVNMKIARVVNLNQTIEKLKKENVWVYGLEADGKEITTTNLKGKVALVVGSEGFGISHLTKQNCDEIVSLKQKGKINSLNASVACAVAVYEVLRQREV